MSAPSSYGDDDPRVKPREVTHIAQHEAGYMFELSCGHTGWTAVHFTFPIVCAQCINELVDEARERRRGSKERS